jgi:hypothetical protein
LLLLTLLVLLLAQPIWRKQPSAKPQKWALLEPGLTLTGNAEKRWNELRAAGYQARELAAGFGYVRPNESSSADREIFDTWSLLRELDARLPSGSSLAVFSSIGSRRFAASDHGCSNAQSSGCTSPRLKIKRGCGWSRSVGHSGGGESRVSSAGATLNRRSMCASPFPR